MKRFLCKGIAAVNAAVMQCVCGHVEEGTRLAGIGLGDIVGEMMMVRGVLNFFKLGFSILFGRFVWVLLGW